MGRAKNLIICGGGSGGHVLPALTVAKAAQENSLEQSKELQILAIGSYAGIESRLFTEARLPYKGISTGKLRRYFSVANFIDIFRILFGTIQSFFILFPYPRKETTVFCTGGFVTVPVAAAAWLQRKRIVIHEQTSRVGLANKIVSFFAETVMTTFEESNKFFPPEKVENLGYPLRKEIFKMSEDHNHFHSEKPLLFLTGGGNGSSLLNKTLFDLLDDLKDAFHIIHQTGRLEFQQYKTQEREGYRVEEFIGEEMITLLDKADVVISRAGAGTVVELMALGKPSIFIPLKIAQKNEQFHNAEEAQKALGSIIIEEDDLNKETLLHAVQSIQKTPRLSKKDINPTQEIVHRLIG